MAPSTVSTGENFRVEYHVSSDDVSEARFSGNIPDGLEEIAGPYISTQSSYQIINGHTSSSSSARISYVFYAEKAGTYTIPTLNIRLGGKSITSRPFTVKVTGNAQSHQQQSAPRMHQQNNDTHANAQDSHADNSNVFIRVSASKNNVVEQEPIKLTYKLYTAAEVTVPSDLKMPNVQDFTIYEVELPQTRHWEHETINGKSYRCITWKQYIVYPQSTGKLTIPGSSVQINRVVRHRNIDPIEEMFNPGSTYHEEEMNIKVPALTLNVKSLPNRPSNFAGGVGQFNMTANLAKKEVKAGEPISITVRISGTGNMKLIKQPTINFPKDFEVYDPKVSDNTKNTNNGIEGSMTYEYIAVPQNKGNFTIPPVEFVYYDSQTGSYKTLKSDAMKVSVAEGDVSSISAEDYQEQLRNSDIYAIKQTSEINYRNTDRFFLSGAYVVIILLLLLSFILLLYIFRKRAIERADIVRMKANRANKVATKKLQQASVLMRLHKRDAFYDEVLRALWGYAADKINIPVESLSKDNIQEKLINNGCNTYSVEKFIDAISECEFARYAPTQDENSGMKTIYEMAVTAITEIEEALKNVAKKGGSTLKTTIIIAAFMLSAMSASAATTIESANAAYQSGNYQQAITLYEQALKAGNSSELYYNLGNAYYRRNNITKALINYEKAYLYNPTDADIRHNLDYVRTKTIDKLIPSADIFFVSWYKSLVYSLSIYGWALFSLLMIIISLIALLTYLFTNNDLLRKFGFWTTLLTFLLFIFSVIFAFQQTNNITNSNCGIVTAEQVAVKKTPESGSETVVTIHEGTHLEVVDDGMSEWKEIELPDGKTGWIPTNSFTLIRASIAE